MPAPTTACTDCGVTILTDTAAKNGGKCIPCARGTRSRIEEGKRWAAERRQRERTTREAVERIRRKAHPCLGDFIAEDDPAGVLWAFLIAALFRNEASPARIEILTPSAKAIWFAGVLDGEVCNGGFHQYFSNSSGKYAHETLFALYELRAAPVADLLQRAIHAFPNKRVPAQRKERNDELAKANAEALDALDTEYYALAKVNGEAVFERILSFMRQRSAERILKD